MDNSEPRGYGHNIWPSARPNVKTKDELLRDLVSYCYGMAGTVPQGGPDGYDDVGQKLAAILDGEL